MNTAENYITKQYDQMFIKNHISVSGSYSCYAAGLICIRNDFTALYLLDGNDRFIKLTIPGYFPFFVKETEYGSL